MKKLIIFDWGRTLYNPETKDIFGETIPTLDYLKPKYRLAIVSLVVNGDIESRREILNKNKLEKYFELISFTTEDKDALYKETLRKLGVDAKEAIIVDDRVIRGIKWGNQNATTTIWLQKGKFENELPDAETGTPTFTIKNLREIKTIL